MVPTLLAGSISIALVALAQGAGIRPALPDPDGARASSSRDFLGQGLGNLAGAFFQSPPRVDRSRVQRCLRTAGP